ncbi:hypothetical protein D3C72_1782590 [compost metagenome]
MPLACGSIASHRTVATSVGVVLNDLRNRIQNPAKAGEIDVFVVWFHNLLSKPCFAILVVLQFFVGQAELFPGKGFG